MAKLTFSYHDPEFLKTFLDATGGIKSRYETGLSQKEQREMTAVVKQARYLGLLPKYVPVKVERRSKNTGVSGRGG